MNRLSQYTEKELSSAAKRLRFPGSLEKEFRSSILKKTIEFNKIGGILFIFLYFFNVFTDFYAFPELKTFSIINRTGVLIYGLICFAISGWKPMQRYFNAIITAGLFVLGMLLITYSVIGHGIFRYLYHSGFMLVLIALYMFKIRFFAASFVGIVLVVGDIWLNLFFSSKADLNIVMHNSGNIFGMLICGMIISYLNELNMRRSFLQNLQIADEKDKVEQRNFLIEKDLVMARKIQEQHIPVNSPSANISAVYLPMDRVGGDFFDYVVFPDSDKIGVFISDVSGHGVPAAFITAMIKTSLIQSGERIHDPAQLLLFINNCLAGRTGGSFVTAMFGIFDFTRRTFLYSNAGHHPPYLIRPDGVEHLDIDKTIPLAVFSRTLVESKGKDWTNYEIHLSAGSRMVLYTDGLVEARKKADPSLYFEYCGLDKVFFENKTLSNKIFLERLLASLTAFRGDDEFEDDICIISVDIP